MRADLRGSLSAEQVARSLFLSQGSGEFTQAQIQVFNRAVAIAQARVKFAFAQGQDVGAQFQTLFVCEPGVVALFQRCAAFAFFERLHPERLGDVGDAFGQAVQGRSELAEQY